MRTEPHGLDRMGFVNYWMISGIANIGFLIFFLTQSIGRETYLTVLVNDRAYWEEIRLASAVVVALLVAIAIISFILGSRTKK
jgi:hypothetical protein